MTEKMHFLDASYSRKILIDEGECTKTCMSRAIEMSTQEIEAYRKCNKKRGANAPPFSMISVGIFSYYTWLSIRSFLMLMIASVGLSSFGHASTQL